MKVGRLGEAKRSSDRVLQINPRVSVPGFWATRGTLHYLEGEIEQAVALWERARTMVSRIGPNRIILSHYYESAGRHEDAQAIVREMLSIQPELKAKGGVEFLARFWEKDWIVPYSIKLNFNLRTCIIKCIMSSTNYLWSRTH